MKAMRSVEKARHANSGTVKVVVLMANGCAATSVTATIDLFLSANIANEQLVGTPVFELVTASFDGNQVDCFGNQTLRPERAIGRIRKADLVVIPGFLHNIFPPKEELDKLVKWLRQRYEKGSALASICTGAFTLAETGLLDEQQATTHWLYASQFRERYPQVQLHPQNIITSGPRLFCSAGSSAGNDLLLHLIAEYGSEELGALCAKILLLDGVRDSQTPYVQYRGNRNHADETIREVQRWMEERIAHLPPVDNIAAEFGFSLRNFNRRFKAALGVTPVAYIQKLRVEQAKILLENSEMQVERITEQVGYEDSNTFRTLFKKQVGISPLAYRKKFRLD